MKYAYLAEDFKYLSEYDYRADKITYMVRDVEVDQVFVEEDDRERPELSKMMCLLKEGDTVVFPYEQFLDRIVELDDILQKLVDKKVVIHFPIEDIDSTSYAGKGLLTAIAKMASLERAKREALLSEVEKRYSPRITSKKPDEE